jgi:hypothetical protein
MGDLTKDDVVKIVKQEMKHGGKKEKRPLTEYQKHMSTCMKKEGATFSSCVELWKEKNKN